MAGPCGVFYTLDLITEEDWDYVVLQEQSVVPSIPEMVRLESRPAAVRLALAAVESGSQVMLFLTWGRRDGLAEVGHSGYSSMQIAIANTYRSIGGAVSGEVAPVGMAWWMARAERPDIGLYQDDGSHPSREGSYLAAVVIAASLLDVDPESLDSPLGLDAATAEALRGFAARAIHGEVPWQG